VVLIARNQEQTMGSLVESILRETKEIDTAEVILVDSASTDRTVEIALGYPVAVLGLPAGAWLCPSAGRAAGFAVSTGRRVLFLDGDMELCSGWLTPALRALDADPHLAAVTGLLVDGTGGEAKPPTDPLGRVIVNGEPGWELPHPAGAAVYQRPALEEVGCFNPYLRSDEEPELALRLRARGYRIASLAQPAVVHHQPIPGGFAVMRARRRRGLFLGHGQIVRSFVGRPGLGLLLRERGYALVPLAVLCAGGAAIGVSTWTRRRRWIGGWLVVVAGVLSADATRRRSARATALAVFIRLLFAEGLLRGFWVPLGDPQQHPALLGSHWIRRPEASGIR
jgi:glycosyltransferase involved in cell wall biosynthesis